METGDHIFLTVPELLDSIRIDFKQYPAQIDLFRKLVPILYNGTSVVVESGQHEGVWFRAGRKSKPRRIRDDALGNLLCKKLVSTTLAPETLSEIAHHVFWIETKQGVHPETGKPGVWLDTGMRHFSCTQCGKCCKTLRYQNECRPEDLALWQTAGRQDILKWVRIVNGGKTGERITIWVDPVTRKLVPICPWLKKEPNGVCYRCQIHEMKPFVCRQYPGTRKHAVMTGCKGFSK